MSLDCWGDFIHTPDNHGEERGGGGNQRSPDSFEGTGGVSLLDTFINSCQPMPSSVLVISGSRLPSTNSTALVAAPSATTSGVVAELKKHEFVGKGGAWLNADEMKRVLGHVPL